MTHEQNERGASSKSIRQLSDSRACCCRRRDARPFFTLAPFCTYWMFGAPVSLYLYQLQYEH